MNNTLSEVKSCCFTGYRPSKFPFNLNRDNCEFLKFENKLINTILYLINEENCRIFYTGMAMGFDIIAAEIILLLKQKLKSKEISLYCIVPFKGQEQKYNYIWRTKYERILKNSDKIVYTSDNYFKGCYQKRNRYMVNCSDYVLTWYDGKNGGTRNTISYAQSKLRFIFNINEKYENNLNQSQMTINY